MRSSKGVAAGLAALSLLLALPAAAAGNGADQAEKIRRLDIMLMVTGLRCRTTADNFQSDYGRFTRAHLGTLNAASDSLKADLSRRFGVSQGRVSQLRREMETDRRQFHGEGVATELEAVAAA